MSEVFLLVPDLSFSPGCSPKHAAAPRDTRVWCLGGARGEGTQGAAYSRSLEDPPLQDGASGGWARRSALGACVGPERLLMAPLLLQPSDSAEPAHVLAEHCWRRHGSKLGRPLALLVVFKVPGLPPITYPNSVSLGGKMHQISVASVVWGDLSQLPWTMIVERRRKKSSPQLAFLSKSCGLLKL